MPRARQGFVIASWYNQSAVANDLGAIAHVCGYTRYIAGHCLAQDVGKALTADRAERQRVKSRIDHFDVRTAAKQNDAPIEIKRPDQFQQLRIIGRHPIAAKDKFRIGIILLKERGGAEKSLHVFHWMVARNQTNYRRIGGKSQPIS